MWWLSEEAGPDEDLGPFRKLWEDAWDYSKMMMPRFKASVDGEPADCKDIDCKRCDLNTDSLECPAGLVYVALAEAHDMVKSMEGKDGKGKK